MQEVPGGEGQAIDEQAPDVPTFSKHSLSLRRGAASRAHRTGRPLPDKEQEESLMLSFVQVGLLFVSIMMMGE